MPSVKSKIMSKPTQLATTEKKAVIQTNYQAAEALMAQAIDKGTPVETLERLLTMRRELKSEAAKEAYDSAMSDFQSDCPIIKKSKKVLNKDKSLRYSYAPLDAIIIQTKSTIKKHGFSYKIDALVEEKWVEAICVVTHELGHNEKSGFRVPIDPEAYMNSPQKFASALTFAKRYAFCDAFGILTSDEDNDAISAGEPYTEDTFIKAKDMIAKVKDKKSLKDFKEKIFNSKKYSDKQKSSLIDTIDAHLDQI